MFTEGAGFYFISPVPPGNPKKEGIFNANLAPIVRICRLPGADAAECIAGTGAYNVTFTLNTTPAITVDAAGEQYQVTWAGLNDLKAASSNRHYRITVSLDASAAPLGTADVQLTDGGGSGLNVSGNSLPIKFWISNEATCDVEDCIAFAVSTRDGGSGILEEEEGTTPVGTAGFQFNPLFCLNDDECGEYVTVIAARYRGPQRCVPNPENTVDRDGDPAPISTATLQYDVCVQVRTIPAGVPFEPGKVLVGLCVDDRAESTGRLRFLKVHEDDDDSAVGQAPVDLEGGPLGNDFFSGAFECGADPFGDLDPVGPLGAAGSGVFDRLAARVGRVLSKVGVHLLRPAPLYARRRDVPFGASPSDFGSRLGVVLPVVAKFENDFGAGSPGGAANPQPRVRVLAVQPDGSGESDLRGVPWVQVHFDPADGDGATVPANGIVETNNDGYAPASWTLGSIGTNPQELVTRVGAPREFDASFDKFPNHEDTSNTACTPGAAGCYWWATHTFTAFARVYDAVFLSPLGQSGSGLTNEKIQASRLTVRVCGPFIDRADAEEFDCPVVEFSATPVAKTNYYETAWKTSKTTVENALYRIDVLVDGGLADWFLVRRGGGGGTDAQDVYQFQNGSQLPIKFVLVALAS